MNLEWLKTHLERGVNPLVHDRAAGVSELERGRPLHMARLPTGIATMKKWSCRSSSGLTMLSTTPCPTPRPLACPESPIRRVCEEPLNRVLSAPYSMSVS